MPFGIERSLHQVTTALVVCAALPSALGQQRTANDNVRSPEIDAQGRVTFRLYAPQAQQVRLQPEGRRHSRHNAGAVEKRVGAIQHGERSGWGLVNPNRSDPARSVPIQLPSRRRSDDRPAQSSLQ
jgi:1,4-alpha-glucan branching enzyme